MLQERDLPEHYRVWRREDGQRGLTAGPLYKATDLRGNRIVVLRFFEGGDLEALIRRTARLLEVAAPGVAALSDVFTKDQTLVAVTEFIVGESLAERVARRGPLAPELVWEMAVQSLDALAALHGRGVCHGQLAPSKILFPDDASKHGLIKLVDCGLPGPSQIGLGKADEEEPGAPNDFRRLGISLWCALTGSFPFGGNPAAFAEGAPLTEPLLAVLTALLCGEPDRQPNATRLLLEALQVRRSARLTPETGGGVLPDTLAVAARVEPLALPTAGITRRVEPATARRGAYALPIPLPPEPSVKSGVPMSSAGAAAAVPLIIPPPAIAPPAADRSDVGLRAVVPHPPAPLPARTEEETPAREVEQSAVPTKLDGVTKERGTVEDETARNRRGRGGLVASLALLIGGAAAYLVYTEMGIHPGTRPPSAQVFTAPVVPAPTVPPQPPRPAPLQARVDRIRELQPSLLSTLQFVPQMQRITTVVLPTHAGPPDEATIARLKEAFEWTRPESPNFHRTTMLFILGYVNGLPDAERVPASQQCADDWAGALARSGFTSPVYACGLGAAEGLPEVQTAAAKVDRFVEVWVAFTLM